MIKSSWMVLMKLMLQKFFSNDTKDYFFDDSVSEKFCRLIGELSTAFGCSYVDDHLSADDHHCFDGQDTDFCVMSFITTEEY